MHTSSGWRLPTLPLGAAAPRRWSARWARRSARWSHGSRPATIGTLPYTARRWRARPAALQAALAGAAEAPLAAAGLSAEGIALARRANGLGNTHLASDVECALHFFRAALAAAVANVRINHHFIKDAETVRAQEERLVAIVDAASAPLQRLLPSLP